jgi:molybdopterin-guanine dinucleotide biosynthesis protein B
VIGITPTLTATFETRGKDDHESEPEALATLLADLRDRGYEYALIEGFSAAAPPAIAVGDSDAEGNEEAILARVDDPESADVETLVTRIRGLDPWTGGP